MAQPAITPWHTLVVALFCAMAGGFTYSYSTFSNALQHAFDFSEANKELIGLAPFLINGFTVTSGLIVDRTSTTVGCAIGGGLMALAFGLLGAVASKQIHLGPAPVAACFAFFAAGSAGASLIICSTYTVLSKNFHAHRSGVVSVAKAWQGLAAGVSTAIFTGFAPSADVEPERLRFLFFVSAMGAVPILVAPFLRALPSRSTRQPVSSLLVPAQWRMPLCYVLTVVLIAATSASTLYHGSSATVLGALLLVLLLFPCVLLLPRQSCIGGGSSSAAAGPLAAEDSLALTLDDPGDGPIDGEPMAETMAEGMDSDASGQQQLLPKRKDDDDDAAAASSRSLALDGGPCDIICTVDFYLLWLCAFALQSGGIFLFTNLGSMVQSRSGETVQAATALTILSCAQSLARLVAGSVSDAIFVRRGLPRTLCFPVLMLMMAAGHGLLCAPGPIALFGGVILAALAFGSTFPLLVLVVAELFGQKRFASNYMIFDGSPGALGAILLAKVLADAVFRAHATPDGKCAGDDCFRLSHAVVSAVQLLVAVAGTVLSLRIWSRSRGHMIRQSGSAK